MTDNEMRVHQIHKRYFSLILRHGTEAEKEKVKETLEVMRAWRDGFIESTWEPLDCITLPGFLIKKCERVARERHGIARRRALKNKHGVTRTLEEEIRSTEAQYTACLLLDLTLSVPMDYREARRDGNIGGGLSAFCPRPGNYSLFIDEDEVSKRRVFLMLQEGEHCYRCAGWCRAGEFQRDEYRRDFNRNGTASHPYVVPAEQLMQLREWFGFPRSDLTSWHDYGLETT